MEGKTIKQINVSDYAENKHMINSQIIEKYAETVGDKNPVHLDDVFAAKTPFKKRIAHGMLIAGYISEAIGMELPGPGCIYAKQELLFTKPVYIGDEITVRIEVVGKNEEKNRVELSTICYNQDEEIVIKGTAVVLPRRE